MSRNFVRFRRPFFPDRLNTWNAAKLRRIFSAIWNDVTNIKQAIIKWSFIIHFCDTRQHIFLNRSEIFTHSESMFQISANNYNNYNIMLAPCVYVEVSFGIQMLVSCTVQRFPMWHVCVYGSGVHIEAGTKWTQFRWRHFPFLFLEYKLLYFNSNVTEVFSEGPSDNKSVLVQIVAWHRTCNKPLSEPMMAWFTYAYICIARPQWVNTFMYAVFFQQPFPTSQVICIFVVRARESLTLVFLSHRYAIDFDHANSCFETNI